MSKWPRKSFIYEINTAVWLTQLSEHYKRPVTLGDVPEEVINEIADMQFEAVWLMGVWQRSEAGRKSALNYLHEYRPVLPDLTKDDVIGSAYAIGAYEVDHRLGGRDGLANLRERLRARGVRLILDFVPNHVAVDHPWVREHPEYMVHGTEETFKKHPGMFYTANGSHEPLVIAHGRDPYFPSWIDTAQVNAFSPEYRAVARDTLLDIAAQCDGVRCDMAMLMVNRIFHQTWGAYIDTPEPKEEFWTEIIPAIKAQHPDFLFIAEVYWDMEFELQQQGFDLTYDKTLYDRMLEGNVSKVRDHLIAEIEFQQRMIRFIENHDEARIAASAGIEKSRALATLICTLPGPVLLHDGQFTGRLCKLPVQIKRQSYERPNRALEHFYQRLLAETDDDIYQNGEWDLFDIYPPYDDGVNTHGNLIAYGWNDGSEYRLVVINMTPTWSQGVVRLDGWDKLKGSHWHMFDVLNGVTAIRKGATILKHGFYIESEPYQSMVFHLESTRNTKQADYVRRVNSFQV